MKEMDFTSAGFDEIVRVLTREANRRDAERGKYKGLMPNQRRRQENLTHAQGRVHGTVYLNGQPRSNGQQRKK